MKRNNVLITGGAGFLGGFLVDMLLKNKSVDITILDKLEIQSSQKYPKRVHYLKGDILSQATIVKAIALNGPFDTVYHLASAMPNKALSDDLSWKINVLGTINLITEAVKHNVKSFIFTSSNVVYGIPPSLPITEGTPTHPLEIYGKSKLQAEAELAKFQKDINIQIFRCPFITGVGRLGLQGILYEFISENKNVYVLGQGSNIYQFAEASDVCDALIKASSMKGFDIYTIGGDGVKPLRELYADVIHYAGSCSKIVSLPKAPSLVLLVIMDKLGISPLGVYQYTMLSRSLYADTSKIKRKLNWRPKKTNSESFIENYRWYLEHKGSFHEMGSGGFSDNRSLPKLKAFKLLKLIS